MSRRLLPLLALLPIGALGLWLWREQATRIWLADFIAACF